MSRQRTPFQRKPNTLLYLAAFLIPAALMLILFICIPALNAGTVGIMVPVSVLFTLAVSRIMYKKGLL